VKVLKDLNSHLKMLLVGAKPPESGLVSLGGMWFTTYPSGLPRRLKVMNSLWLGEGRQCCVDVANMVSLIKLGPEFNLSSVTDPFSGDNEEYPKWLDRFISHYQWSGPRLFPKEGRLHMSMKAGPNAPSALLSAGLDALAIAANGSVKEKFQRFCEKLDRGDLYARFESLTTFARRRGLSTEMGDRNFHLAKLAFLADKAGKTRVVFILNWWHQELMMPLHSTLMGWLRSQPQDGTYDQKRAAAIVQEWTKQGLSLWCYDLTAATDRWPKQMQTRLLHLIVGQDWAEAWEHVMGIDPYVPMLQGTVSYTVGQPMGAYASWATFAVTHHMLLRFLCAERGVDVGCYVILGDDLVIANQAIAEDYQRVVRLLGVQISATKSVVATNLKPGYSGAEFAKKLFVNGTDVSPVSPSILDRVWNHHQWWMVTALIKNLDGRQCNVNCTKSLLRFSPPLERLINLLSRRDRQLLEICLANPIAVGPLTGNPSVSLDTIPIWCDHVNPFAEADSIHYQITLLERVTEQISQKISDIINIRERLLGTAENSAVNPFLTIPAHPIHEVIHGLGETLRGLMSAIANGEMPNGFLDVLMDISYLESLYLRGESHRQWKARKDLRLEMGPRLVLKAWSQVTDQRLPR